MQECRICREPLGPAELTVSTPSVTSLSTALDCDTAVYVCANCAHAQSPDLPDLKAFYDTEYKISLHTDGHDQLYETANGRDVFRTDHQAKLALATNPPKGAKVLDFGCGKAVTLQKMLAERDDLVPHVFDVSRDYLEHWSQWIPSDNQSTYELPDRWQGYFDLIAAHFVFEHIADPVEVLRDLSRHLAPQGKLLFIVPNPVANSGDLLVVDHVNHFSTTSVEELARQCGLDIIVHDTDSFRGGHVVVFSQAADTAPAPRPNAASDHAELTSLCAFWGNAITKIGNAGAGWFGKSVGIYGAGFYGSIIRQRLAGDPACFLDANPHVHGRDHLGVPVLAPQDMPNDLDVLICCLNPAIARSVVHPDAEWMRGTPQIVYLD